MTETVLGKIDDLDEDFKISSKVVFNVLMNLLIDTVVIVFRR